MRWVATKFASTFHWFDWDVIESNCLHWFATECRNSQHLKENIDCTFLWWGKMMPGLNSRGLTDYFLGRMVGLTTPPLGQILGMRPASPPPVFAEWCGVGESWGAWSLETLAKFRHFFLFWTKTRYYSNLVLIDVLLWVPYLTWSSRHVCIERTSCIAWLGTLGGGRLFLMFWISIDRAVRNWMCSLDFLFP